MSRFGGKKRALTKEEITYYTKELGGEYVIGRQLGRSGEMSSAYLLTDKKGNHFVLKIPNDSEELEKWGNIQKRAKERRNLYVGDYQGRINVPNTLKIGRDFVVEELAEGKEFFNFVYQKLSPIQKKKVAQDLGEFISYSHQRTVTGKMAKLYPNQQDRISWQDMYDYYEPVLTENEKKALRKEMKIHMQQKEAPEVLAFRDYRFSNVLWDDKKKRLSVIDFGCTKNASVYEEFTSNAAGSTQMSYQFWADVINAYNHAPKKHSISIDLETVRHNCFLGIYHEFARCNIGRNPPEKYLKELRAELKKLDELMPPSVPRKTLAKGKLMPKMRKGEPR